MRYYFLFSICLILSSSLYLYSCATRSIPSGGPKDTIPPQLINIIPKNKSINFHGKTIVLTFDEYIKTKDINNQLIITPRLNEENEYKINKRILTINLKEDLDSNTTYTFNFQEAVQDITESNPARDLVLAFSTGDYIDSLSIEGYVKELLTNKPVQNAVVALFLHNDTLDIFNSKPQYFTRSKKDGYFKLENLKNQTYKIYAFNDANKNLIAQSDTESYGFIADSIVLDTSITDINIPLIKRNVKEFRLQSARPSGKYFEVKFNKYIEDYNFEINKTQEDSLISNKAADPGVIRIYNTIKADSIETILTAIDTIGQTIIDTLFIKFAPTQRKSDPISYKISPASNSSIQEKFEAKISFNKPVINIDFDSLFIYYDSLTIVPIVQEDLNWNKFQDELTVNKHLDRSLLEKEIPIEQVKDTINVPNKDIKDTLVTEQSIIPKKSTNKKESVKTKEKNKFDKRNNQVMLFMSKGTFISVENDTLPEISALYTFTKTEDTGLIKGIITTDKESYFIQLLSNNKVIKETKGEGNFNFQHIPPGEYQLRILIDNNGDGIWYPGNILKNIPPEEIYFYPEPVIIRANWERELDEITF